VVGGALGGWFEMAGAGSAGVEAPFHG